MTQEVKVILTLEVDTILPMEVLKYRLKDGCNIYINGEVAASCIKIEVREEKDIYKNE